MMRHLKAGLVLATFAAFAMMQGSAKAQFLPGSTITSPDGAFTVGISPQGDLYDPGTNVGFLRNADGYDPIAPGSPRDSWGISAGAVGSIADNAGGGTTVTGFGTVFGAHSATTTATDSTGSLGITQNFSFAANNILLDQITVTNLTGAPVAALFQRDVDYDIAPTEFNELTKIPAAGPPVIDTSFNGFESANPLDPYGFSGFPAGGTFGPGDLGAGIKIDLGTLLPGQSTTFDYFYGINSGANNGTGDTTSPSGLTAQAMGLGASLVLTGFSSDGDFNTATNSIILGFGPAVPEPSSIAALGTAIVLCGLGRLRSRNRKNKTA